MTPRFYQVGGCVRDTLLGRKSKDIDFSVEAESYDAMRAAVVERCGSEDAIKVEKREFVTIRAIDPKLGGVDFVLCRKDGEYTDGRRPDGVFAGTLQDDLARRDFTMNAIAQAEDGTLIDPFNGVADLKMGLIRCVGNTQKRMSEDALRILRAIRFGITKQFTFAPELHAYLYTPEAAASLDCVSIERIREELVKCFATDTMLTLQVLEEFWRIRAAIFKRNLKLVPTVFT